MSAARSGVIVVDVPRRRFGLWYPRALGGFNPPHAQRRRRNATLCYWGGLHRSLHAVSLSQRPRVSVRRDATLSHCIIAAFSFGARADRPSRSSTAAREPAGVEPGRSDPHR
jgi:hypothetical protein